jgi:hypothetical protein
MQNALIVVAASAAWRLPFIGFFVAGGALEEENVGVGCNPHFPHERACCDIAEAG